MGKEKEVTVLAVGDINVNRDRPETTYAYTGALLRDADITFG